MGVAVGSGLPMRSVETTAATQRGIGSASWAADRGRYLREERRRAAAHSDAIRAPGRTRTSISSLEGASSLCPTTSRIWMP